MSKERLKIVINPLALSFTKTVLWSKKTSTECEMMQIILNDFLDHKSEFVLTDIRDRGRETDPGYHLNAIPNSRNITARILAPLKTARINYCIGHFEAAIAMAATACEMTAILLHEITAEIETPDSFKDEYRQFLIEQKFDTCKHAKRLEMLTNLEPSPQDFIRSAFKVAALRNKYLHVLRLDLSRKKEDASEAYFEAIKAIDSVIGLHPSSISGCLHLDEGPLKRYLKLEGLVVDD